MITYIIRLELSKPNKRNGWKGDDLEFLDVLKKRRSIRSYEDRKVEEDKLLDVLKAGRAAPTSYNNQEFKIVAVRDKTRIGQLFHACNEQDFVKEAPVLLVCCGTNPEQEMMCGQLSHTVDVSIVATHMMLRATDLDLGTCWLGSFNEKKVKQILDIPDNVRVVTILTLGYPRFQLAEKSRKPLEKLICFDKYRS